MVRPATSLLIVQSTLIAWFIFRQLSQVPFRLTMISRDALVQHIDSIAPTKEDLGVALFLARRRRMSELVKVIIYSYSSVIFSFGKCSSATFWHYHN